MKLFITCGPLACLSMMVASCEIHDSTAQTGLAERAPSAAPATAYHLYVGPDGADTNVGTESAPFRSIERASLSAQPDTTVHVAPGSYLGGFKTTASGSAQARIYYVSSTRWGAKIVPQPKADNLTAWENRGNYVDIIGFEVDGRAYQGGMQWMNGIYSGGSYDSIRNNHVHHIATNVPCTTTDGAGIGIESYYHGIQSDVIGNNVHDIGPAGCRAIQGINMNTSGTVANNIVYRAAYAGIHLWHDANHVLIANNTVTSSTIGILVGGGDFYFTQGPNDHTHVSNNLVYDNKNGITELGATGKANTYTNNLVYQNSAGDWSLANGLVPNGSVAAAPRFSDYKRIGTPDFRLTSGSPAIGKGGAMHAHPSDFAGAPRNANTGFDIGAFQH